MGQYQIFMGGKLKKYRIYSSKNKNHVVPTPPTVDLPLIAM